MTYSTDIPLCESFDAFAWDPDEVRDLIRPLRSASTTRVSPSATTPSSSLGRRWPMSNNPTDESTHRLGFSIGRCQTVRVRTDTTADKTALTTSFSSRIPKRVQSSWAFTSGTNQTPTRRQKRKRKPRPLLRPSTCPAGWIDQYHVAQCTLKHTKQIAAFWSVWDVKEVRPDLSEDQAWQVLNRSRIPTTPTRESPGTPYG